MKKNEEERKKFQKWKCKCFSFQERGAVPGKRVFWRGDNGNNSIRNVGTIETAPGKRLEFAHDRA